MPGGETPPIHTILTGRGVSQKWVRGHTRRPTPNVRTQDDEAGGAVDYRWKLVLAPAPDSTPAASRRKDGMLVASELFREDELFHDDGFR